MKPPIPDPTDTMPEPVNWQQTRHTTALAVKFFLVMLAALAIYGAGWLYGMHRQGFTVYVVHAPE